MVADARLLDDDAPEAFRSVPLWREVRGEVGDGDNNARTKRPLTVWPGAYLRRSSRTRRWPNTAGVSHTAGVLLHSAQSAIAHGGATALSEACFFLEREMGRLSNATRLDSPRTQLVPRASTCAARSPRASRQRRRSRSARPGKGWGRSEREREARWHGGDLPEAARPACWLPSTYPEPRSSRAPTRRGPCRLGAAPPPAATRTAAAQPR